MEDIRQYMHDKVQSLQSEILRHGQAIADSQLAQKTSDSLRTELDLQKQHHQQLEQQVSSFQQFEVAFRSSAAQLEKERDELQAAVREHAAQSQKSELQAKHLHDQLSSTQLCENIAYG
jgi:allophanate hydrolase subunit 1